MENQTDDEFKEIIGDIIANKKVQEMKKYRQHGNVDCFEHCYMVSYGCYRVCKKLNLDYVSGARAGMLHDFYLYDWRKKSQGHKPLHAFHHGLTAYKNASKEFTLNKREKDSIIKHMWPLIIIPPRYAEGFVLTLVDKCCTFKEMLKFYKNKFRKDKK